MHIQSQILYFIQLIYSFIALDDESVILVSHVKNNLK